MNFSRIFIERPIMTVLIFLTVVLFGIAAYETLPISDLPQVKSPVITITANLPGASPELMATAVATPIEDQCMQIPGIESIISQNTLGSTQITITFSLDIDVNMAAPDVQAAIARSLAYLPALPQQPTYQKYNPSDDPIIYILVHSETLTSGALYDIGNKRIAQRINTIDGVSEVEVHGAQSAATIQVDPKKMQAYGIGLQDVADALKQSTPIIPGGSINGKFKAFAINPDGQMTDEKQYNKLILKYQNGAPVRIENIGRAYNGLQNDVLNTVFFKDGKNIKMPVLVMARKQAGTNTIKITDTIINLLDELRKEIPGSVAIDVLYNRSVTILESINDVKTTLLLAFILVILVIFLFLGRLSDTVIPSISLPISIVATFLVMSAVGFTLDNLSLMGLTLAVGFVVDDAIVVLENTVRLIEEGHNPFDAAIKSAKEITGTVISMTLSLVTVFIPLVFMGGIVGRTFREFALTVVIAVMCSGIISLTLSPMMCARMLKPIDKNKNKNFLQRFADWFVGKMISKYKIALYFVLKHKYISIIFWLFCISGSLLFYSIVPKGFIPDGDSGVIKGGILAPLGTSTEMMKKFQESINNVLQKNDYIKHFYTLTGANEGADQSTGMVVMLLKDRDKRPAIDKIVKQLNTQFAKIQFPLGFVFITPYPVLEIATGGTSAAAGAKYSYKITGPYSNQVYSCAQKIEAEMRKTPYFYGIQTSVKLNMPQIKITLLRDRASTLGLTAQDIQAALANAFAQPKTTQFTTDVDQYWVTLEVSKKYQDAIRDLNNIFIKSSLNGQMIPLRDVIKWEEVVGPQTVWHSQELISGALSFNVLPEYPLSKATKAIENAARKILEPGMVGVFEGEAQEFQDAMASMGVLVIVAVFLLYVILGILYESYIHPFTVLTTLPVAAFGGIGTLILFKQELNLYSDVGLFMLLGIIAKNGIMMVDFANQNIEQGQNSFDAIYHSCLVRFRPILMTGVAAIMGAVPIAIGLGADSSRVPLGLVIVGGLIFAQIITLFVTPGIFLYMETFQEKFLNKFELTRSKTAKINK